MRSAVHKMSLRSTLTAIISELVLWTTVVLAVYSLGAFIGILGPKARQHQGQTITLYFKDVSQLTEGSPVHFMGTDIGYVSQVKPNGNRVKVQFTTYPEVMPIPKGAHFTVEFNGLAGAKTLEVLPPKQPRHGHIDYDRYFVDEPIRLQDVSKSQMLLADALESSAKNLAKTLDYVRDQNTLIEKLGLANQRILEMDRTLVYYLESLRHATEKVNVTITATTNRINTFYQGFLVMQQATQPDRFRQRWYGGVEALNDGAIALTGFFDNTRTERLDRFSRYTSYSHAPLSELKNRLEARVPQIIGGLIRFNTGLSRTETILTRIDQVVRQRDWVAQLRAFRQRTQRWAEGSRRLVTPPPKR